MPWDAMTAAGLARIPMAPSMAGSVATRISIASGVSCFQ